MIQYQILQTNITRTVWQTVRRITDEILGVKGLTRYAKLSVAAQVFTAIKFLLNTTTLLVIDKEPRMMIYLQESIIIVFCYF